MKDAYSHYIPEQGIGLKNNRVYMYLCNPVFISVEMATVDSDCLGERS